MSEDIVLHAKGLKKTFGALVAANDINVEVPASARLALIGSNGAGKTTFVNMVTGYMKPDAGEVLLDGRNVVGLSPRRITRLGVCRSFQIPQLCETMTPIENLIVAGTIASKEKTSFFRPVANKASIDHAQEILSRFDLSAYANQPVEQLPGGVRKLIDIAMALVSHPRVLLLDEPTSGVSSEEKFPLMERVMAALSAEKAAVIFVEHDMEVVSRYADRVLAFYSGEIIADDAPDAVLADASVQKFVTGTAR